MNRWFIMGNPTTFVSLRCGNTFVYIVSWDDITLRTLPDSHLEEISYSSECGVQKYYNYEAISKFHFLSVGLCFCF